MITVEERDIKIDESTAMAAVEPNCVTKSELNPDPSKTYVGFTPRSAELPQVGSNTRTWNEVKPYIEIFVGMTSSP